MSSKVRGYIGGKEIFLGKDNMKKCDFCDKFVTPINFMWHKTYKEMKRFQDILGEIPNEIAGNIGKKIICKSCLGDLEMLLPYEYIDND